MWIVFSVISFGFCGVLAFFKLSFSYLTSASSGACEVLPSPSEQRLHLYKIPR